MEQTARFQAARIDILPDGVLLAYMLQDRLPPALPRPVQPFGCAVANCTAPDDASHEVMADAQQATSGSDEESRGQLARLYQLWQADEFDMPAISSTQHQGHRHTPEEPSGEDMGTSLGPHSCDSCASFCDAQLSSPGMIGALAPLHGATGESAASLSELSSFVAALLPDDSQ